MTELLSVSGRSRREGKGWNAISAKERRRKGVEVIETEKRKKKKKKKDTDGKTRGRVRRRVSCRMKGGVLASYVLPPNKIASLPRPPPPSTSRSRIHLNEKLICSARASAMDEWRRPEREREGGG